ncbi:tetraspanin-33 isoform X2 [Syngnathus typhle]|uniref:tetraspanin-33 isoform X2 n=1 Tax=Syngnathus typhle TaxID=161592 RepID=UPI002A6A58FA|nr:tetraspanin-33 isoform X2 [Syngnathus typhle]
MQHRLPHARSEVPLRRGTSSSATVAAMRGYRVVKYLLFILCYVFWVLSTVLIAVGIYAKVAKEKDVVDTLTLDPALLLMVIGSLTFFITFLGCLGALRNVTCLLKTFVCILALLLLLQLTTGVAAYLFTDTVMERTERLMMMSIVGYREDRDLENAIDFVQKKFQCCGVEGYRDWSRNVYFDCSDANPSVEACSIPFSCCMAPGNQLVLNTMCGFGTQRQEWSLAQQGVFLDGCFDKIARWLKQNARMVGGLAGGLVLFQTCTMSLAWAQVCWINKVGRRKAMPASRIASLQKKDHMWFPAFADFHKQ